MADSTVANTASVHDDTGMPGHLVYWGIFIGFCLMIIGTGTIILFRGAVPQPLSTLTICVGFGLVLAAFGARAGGAIGGFAVVGAGAIAIILFVLVQRYIDNQPPTINKRGHISGDFSKVADFRIIDEDPLYTRRDRNTGALRFILVEKKFQSPRVTVQVDTTEKGEGREFFEMVAASERIAKKYLESEPSIISWQFDYANRQIKDSGTVIFSTPKDLDEQILKGTTLFFAPKRMNLTTTANAADGEADAREILGQLRSDDTAIRRNARESLVSLGPAAAPAMMEALRKNKTDYRTRLGITYGLSGMLRKDPAARNELMRKLNAQDFDLLQEMTFDADPTLRLQATEFLYRLGDSRSVNPSLKGVTSNDARNAPNSALILKGIYKNLPAPEQRILESAIEPHRLKIDPKSLAIIESIEASR